MSQGVSEEELFPFKAPAGLDIHARRGDEIALSIMAEIVQQRRTVGAIDLSLFKEETSAAAVAVDPICGMKVEIATAKYTHEHEGERYYFCCAGCQRKFTQEPESYLRRAAPTA
jgi:xanthine dehydrogenase accessory factor